MPGIIASLERYGETCGSILTTPLVAFTKPALVDALKTVVLETLGSALSIGGQTLVNLSISLAI